MCRGVCVAVLSVPVTAGASCVCVYNPAELTRAEGGGRVGGSLQRIADINYLVGGGLLGVCLNRNRLGLDHALRHHHQACPPTLLAFP